LTSSSSGRWRFAAPALRRRQRLTLAAHGITEAHVSIVGPLLRPVGIRTVPDRRLRGALWLGAQMMSWVEVRTERGGFCLGAVGEEAFPRGLAAQGRGRHDQGAGHRDAGPVFRTNETRQDRRRRHR
jgi:hypothetical protein